MSKVITEWVFKVENIPMCKKKLIVILNLCVKSIEVQIFNWQIHFRPFNDILHLHVFCSLPVSFVIGQALARPKPRLKPSSNLKPK